MHTQQNKQCLTCLASIPNTVKSTPYEFKLITLYMYTMRGEGHKHMMTLNTYEYQVIAHAHVPNGIHVATNFHREHSRAEDSNRLPAILH